MIGTSLPAQGESVSPRETLRIRGEQTQWRYVAFLCPHGNRSHAASEGRYRVSDLAVTAPELNAGAGVGEKPQRYVFRPTGATFSNRRRQLHCFLLRVS